MKRRMIKIDEEKCNGCGACVNACHEGAIGMVDGKATLLRDDYCDGLGDCLPSCPTGAISFEMREAAAYDEAAVKARLAKLGRKLPAGGCPGSNAHVMRQAGRQQDAAPVGQAGGCPGSRARLMSKDAANAGANAGQAAGGTSHSPAEAAATQLLQWPVQIKLVPVNAPYFNQAKLLIAADCSAFAYGNFHNEFMKGKITLIGCPKLDSVDYSEKLTAILSENEIKSVTVVRMEVPCCGGLEQAAVKALKDCGKMIPWQVVTLSTDGRILD